MHEGHDIYRVETTAKWNLHPNEPVTVPLGPTVHVRDTVRAAAPTSDELLVELNRQKEATKAVIQGGEIVSQKLGELAGSIRQTAQLAAENAQFKKDFITTKERLDALEEQLRAKPSMAPAGREPEQSEKPGW